MFSCGEDGLTFGVDIKSAQLAFTLPRHIDTINDIAFSKSGQWVATASYDKNIAIFNLITMTPKETNAILQNACQNMASAFIVRMMQEATAKLQMPQAKYA